MTPQKFIADSPLEAVKTIRETLGSEAVVLDVRPFHDRNNRGGNSSQRVEVIAHVPEDTKNATNEDQGDPSTTLFDAYLSKQLQPTRHNSSLPLGSSMSLEPNRRKPLRIERYLRQYGISKSLEARIIEAIRARLSPPETATLRQEILACREVLKDLWADSPCDLLADSSPIVLIGPPGSGKTTALCKWCSRVALKDIRPVTAWRLDGLTPNTSDTLELYGDMLGVAIHRFRAVPGDSVNGEQLFIDIPGTSLQDPRETKDLLEILESLPDARRFLTLNAAYDIGVIKEQIKRFEATQPDGIIFTHLDETSKWGQILELSLGTKFTVTALSGGQNIPGYFEAAHPDRFIASLFPSKPQ